MNNTHCTLHNDKNDLLTYLKCTEMHLWWSTWTRQQLTRCRIFSSKSTRKRLAAGIRLDPLGELKRAPEPLAAKMGPTSKGRDGKGLGGEGRGGERRGRGKGGEGKGERKGGDTPSIGWHPPCSKSWKKTLYISAIHGGPLRPNSWHKTGSEP